MKRILISSENKFTNNSYDSWKKRSKINNIKSLSINPNYYECFDKIDKVPEYIIYLSPNNNECNKQIIFRNKDKKCKSKSNKKSKSKKIIKKIRILIPQRSIDFQIKSSDFSKTKKIEDNSKTKSYKEIKDNFTESKK